MSNENICVCCPHLRTIGCHDTKEHRHLVCRLSGQPVANEIVKAKCISNVEWVNCGIIGINEIGKGK